MLVLTRRVTEKVFIGPQISITVVRLEGGQVRLGIEAPRHIPVVRAELVPPEPGERPARVRAPAGRHAQAHRASHEQPAHGKDPHTPHGEPHRHGK